MATHGVKELVRRFGVPVLLLAGIICTSAVLAEVTDDGPPIASAKPDPGAKTPKVDQPRADAESDGPSQQPVTGLGSGQYGGDSTKAPTVPSKNRLMATIGHVEFLYPGLTRTVPVRIKNPFSFAIRITRFDVASPGTSACPARYLSTGTRPANGPAVGANGFVDTHTTIGLNRSAPDSCQSEQFGFSVTVTAARP